MIHFLVNNWPWILALLVFGALLAVFFLAKPVRVGLKTLVTILRLGLSYKKNTGDVPDDVIVGEVTFHCGDREITANLYRPKDWRRHPAIILAHGAIKGGKDDRALRFGGQSLAGAGYIALAPQLENLNRLRLHQDDVDALVDGVRYLAKQEFCNGKIGLLGACLSAPLVFLAAATPDIKQNVAVITCWGGFYNINEWLQAVLAQHYIDDGEARPWKPRPLLIEQAPQWLVELSPDASDRIRLQQMLEGNDGESTKARLSTYGQAMYELLSNRDPEKVKDLWKNLDPKVRQTLDSLSPHTKIDKHSAKIAIIHTFNDDVIPWVESCKLRDAVDHGNEVYFRIFRQFYHVSIEDLLKARISNLHHVIAEAAQFYLYMYSILYQLS
jgi:dienelactone hydrolase